MTLNENSLPASVEVMVMHNPLAFVYNPFTPTIDVSGIKERKPCGTHTFQLSPGDYKIAVSYLWVIRKCGRSSVQFTLAVGETIKVRYCARLLRFSPGSIKVTALK